jgi:anti-anti-sigma regulatory factor
MPTSAARTAPSAVRTSPSTATSTGWRAPGGARRLALAGDDVRAIVGPEGGPHVGAALRWLEAQVEENPELNTAEALTALLRFRPAPSWHQRPASVGADGRRDGRTSARRPADGVPARIAVDGEIDLASAEDVATAVGRARLAASGRLDVDLRRLGFIDGAGMRALVSAATTGPGAEVRIVLAAGSLPHRVAALVGLAAQVDLLVLDRADEPEGAGRAAGGTRRPRAGA